MSFNVILLRREKVVCTNSFLSKRGLHDKIPKRFTAVKSTLLFCGYLCTCLIEWKKLLEKNEITNVCFDCHQVNTVIGWWKHQNTIKAAFCVLSAEFTGQSAKKVIFLFHFISNHEGNNYEDHAFCWKKLCGCLSEDSVNIFIKYIFIWLKLNFKDKE